MPRSPIESTDHTPAALSAAAEQALRDHASAAAAAARTTGPALERLATWAWYGEGEQEGLGELLVEITTALFRSPANAHYGRPLVGEPGSPGWIENLAVAIGSDTPLAQTILAAAIRLDIMAGTSILPSTLAVLFRVDTARIRGLLQKQVLEDASAGSLAAGRSGHRPKGAEIKVTAASALRWLKEQGKAPATATIAGAGKSRRKP